MQNNGEISLIDLESALPVEWFGRGTAFSREHFHEIDIGFPIQDKWNSPWWYFEFLKALTDRRDVGKWHYFKRATMEKFKFRANRLLGRTASDLKVPAGLNESITHLIDNERTD